MLEETKNLKSTLVELKLARSHYSAAVLKLMADLRNKEKQVTVEGVHLFLIDVEKRLIDVIASMASKVGMDAKMVSDVREDSVARSIFLVRFLNVLQTHKTPEYAVAVQQSVASRVELRN